MAGPLGSRGYYTYTSDTGKVYQFYGRVADNAAMGNTATTAGAQPDVPRRIRMRHVWGKAVDLSRRKFWCGDISNGHYQGGGALTPDGTSFQIEGRVGEKDEGAVTD